jgi:hypothetical protein
LTAGVNTGIGLGDQFTRLVVGGAGHPHHHYHLPSL